jgi:hypothetical protein
LLFVFVVSETGYEVPSGYWTAVVCSSDLLLIVAGAGSTNHRAVDNTEPAAGDYISVTDDVAWC